MDKNNSEELLAYAESKFAHELSGTTKLLANVGAGYDFLAKRSAVQAAFSGGGAKFTTTGLDVAPWSVRAGVGLVSSTKTMELTARYDVELRESANNQTLSVKLRMPF